MIMMVSGTKRRGINRDDRGKAAGLRAFRSQQREMTHLPSKLTEIERIPKRKYGKQIGAQPSFLIGSTGSVWLDST